MKNKTTTITYEDLYNKIEKNYDDNMLSEVKKAYDFASNAHSGKKRLSGEDYITHPLNVAYILSDLNVDYITIISALLHETINHGNVTYEEIENNFGSTVASIVSTISKINKLELPDESESSAIYLRKVLVGLASDIRVIFIKLADRLHNMQTIWALDPERQRAKANETMTVLIPIAHRLGINYFKSELEDLCLYYMKPDVYNEISMKLSENETDLKEILNEMEDEISDLLIEHGLKFKIKSRVKSVYSIYNKLNKGKRWNDIYDILALRVILESESDCYTAIGLIHSKYHPIPKRFKDYIAKPKENMYQSLHTGIYGVKGYRFEVQLRTYEMDEIAEKGIASHWSYKENSTKKMQTIMEQKLEIFRNMIETYKDDDNEFITEVSNEILNDVIYVFTPRGDVVELPKGSTPVDFAYRIHSDVGDKMVGAIIDDNIVPLNYELKDGQKITIKTSNNSTPSKEWLDFVKTSHAKNKIKSYFSKQTRAEYIERGKEIFEKELRKRKISFNEILNDENLEKITKDLKLENLDDLYFSIGSLRYTVGYIINLTKDDKTTVTDALIKRVSNNVINKISYKSNVIVAGNDDIRINLAKCCKPVKGDEIIGYITKGEGVTVHKKNCENIKNKSSRLIEVKWNELSDDYYYSDISIEVISGGNYLLDIVQKASIKNVYVESIKTHEYYDKTIYEITVKIKNNIELADFINDLYNFSFIKNVEIK
jgi:GTP pyrophosphokinase